MNGEKVVIIGSGPAGLTAGIYTARAALNPLILEGSQPGGQLTTTSVVENWPGHSHGIDGNKLMAEMRQQALNMGARIQNGLVDKVRNTSEGIAIDMDDGSSILARAVIVCTGASALTLDLPNKQKLMGYGLSTCATCDGFFYRQKKVAVVGGGDSAAEEAHYLSKLASEVTLIVRGDKMRASKAMQEKVLNNKNISILWGSHVVDTTSDANGLTGVVVRNLTEQFILPVHGLFMAIGHHPNTEFLKGVVDMDAQGYVLTQNGTHTNVPGIFAAGDVEDKLYRQAITAAGRGCQAALQCERFLEGH